MIYILSNTERKRKIKDICNKYNDLPSYIVKQIIDYELNKSNKLNLRKAIMNVRYLNEEISKYEDAIKDEIKLVKTINNPDIYELPVFIDCGHGYRRRTTVKFAINKLAELRESKRKIIQNVRYEYAASPFLKMNKNKKSTEETYCPDCARKKGLCWHLFERYDHLPYKYICKCCGREYYENEDE